MAAVGGMLAFGSFGVPIKSKVAQTLDIDPLAMQTYKTSMCFLTCWLVLLYGEELSFTPWGFVSGLFWVPGGIGTIFAIKNAGLAIGIGVGSSFIVLVSFTWGIFVFGEHVHSRLDACFAVGCMMLGLLGMAYYSAPNVIEEALEEEHRLDPAEIGGEFQCLRSVTSDDGEEGQDQLLEMPSVEQHDEEEAVAGDEVVIVDSTPGVYIDELSDSHIVCFGSKWSRRTLGILSATFSGVYGGSIMVPMKWAPDDAKGMGYLISFAIGAATVNLSFWIIRGLYLSRRMGSFSAGYDALPSMHFRKMWRYGGACGLLWSIGNFFSILSVEFLGEGVGYSVVQSSILVSGLWGIFYFHEVQGVKTISKWLLSAAITVLGILLLSYEHHEK